MVVFTSRRQNEPPPCLRLGGSPWAEQPRLILNSLECPPEAGSPYFNLVLQLRLNAEEKKDIVAFLRHCRNQ
jgi:hypothetical protein